MWNLRKLSLQKKSLNRSFTEAFARVSDKEKKRLISMLLVFVCCCCCVRAFVCFSCVMCVSPPPHVFSVCDNDNDVNTCDEHTLHRSYSKMINAMSCSSMLVASTTTWTVAVAVAHDCLHCCYYCCYCSPPSYYYYYLHASS